MINFLNKSKPNRGFIIKLAISIALMILIFHHAPLAEITHQYHSIHMSTLISVCAWLLIGFMLSVWRWHKLVAVADREARFFRTMRGLMLERCFNQAIPSTVGGDVARTFAITHSRLSFSAGFLSVIIDRIYGVLGLSILVLLLSVSLMHFISSPITFFLIIALSLGVTLAGLVALFMPTDWLKFSFLKKISELRSQYNTERLRLFIYSVTLTIVINLVQLRAFELLAIDIGAESLSYWSTLVLVTPAFFLATIPISVSGWGLREAGIVFMLALVGISSTIAAGASILFGLAYAAIGIALGILYLLWSISTRLKIQISLHSESRSKTN